MNIYFTKKQKKNQKDKKKEKKLPTARVEPRNLRHGIGLCVFRQINQL